MIVDGLNEISKSDSCVTVIGSGPVGLAVAHRLISQGISVLVIESGGTAANRSIQAFSLAERVSPLQHDDPMVATSRQLGGTSNLWGARLVPFDPIDFAPRDWVNASWPIDYGQFRDYLDDAVTITAGGSAVFEVDVPAALTSPSRSFHANTLERWANIQQAQRIHAKDIASHPLLTVRTHTTVVGMDFAEDGRLDALHLRDSRSGDSARLPVGEVVLAAGGLESARLLLVAQRGASARFGGVEGPLGRYYMGHVVGEIANISFTDPETARHFDFHVDAHGSYVRRRIVPGDALQREHQLLNCAFWPVVPAIGHAQHHSAILSMIWLVMRVGPVARLVIAEKLRLANLTPEDSPIITHLFNLIKGAPGAALFGMDFLRKRYGGAHRMPGIFIRNPAGRYGLSYHSEHMPNPDSRVTLNTGEDRLGQPQLTIDLRFGEDDAQSVLRTHDLLEKWFAETGAGRIDYMVPREERSVKVLDQARHGAHQIGIVRMGAHRREGVVDGDLRTFDCPNLSVASCAVLPTSGQANPTLTAVALGLRLADRIARSARRPAHSSGVNNG